VIPTIEDIVRGVKDGSIGFNQACRWLEEHVKLARNPVYDEERRMFAAMALQGLCASMPDERRADMLNDYVGGKLEAEVAVRLADKLLIALEPPQREGG
jgi:hypothetical protein